MARDKTHIIAMTGSYFRGDAEAVLHPEDESRFDTVPTPTTNSSTATNTSSNSTSVLLLRGSYTDEIVQVLNPKEKTILHIPNVNSRESTKDKIREVEHIIEELANGKAPIPVRDFNSV
jgi:hypothetical protein